MNKIDILQNVAITMLITCVVVLITAALITDTRNTIGGLIILAVIAVLSWCTISIIKMLSR